jgi:N-acetyl-anhydromuramyl-L-alanine amidase AmpD
MTDDPATERAVEQTYKLRDELLAAADAANLLHRAHDADGSGDLIEIDDDGWMHGRDVIDVPSVRFSPLAHGFENVDGTAWHFTDTRGAGAVNLAHRIAAKGDARSCHAWLDAKGRIAQSVSFRRAAWHAGSDTAIKLGRRSGDGAWVTGGLVYPNSVLAGIEIENAGELRLIQSRDGKSHVWASWPYRWDYVPHGQTSPELPIVVPDEEVHADAPLHGWHVYTPAQVAAAERVARALKTRYGIIRANADWGHSQIDPQRRTDPGPQWQGAAWNDRSKPLGGHLAEILNRVYGESSR